MTPDPAPAGAPPNAQPSHTPAHTPSPERAPDIASFVLRFTQDVWRETSGDPHVRWRGNIRHVQSDTEARFTDFADAVAFIQRQLADLTLASVADADAPGQAQAMTESFRLWERFASGYADLMQRALAQAARQNEDYRRQVGETIERSLQAWNPLLGAGRTATAVPESTAAPPTASAAPSSVEILAAIESLRSDLQAAREHIARLEAMGTQRS